MLKFMISRGYTFVMNYDRTNQLITYSYVNATGKSDNSIDIIDKNSSISYRKSKTGEIRDGDIDAVTINYNGQFKRNTFYSYKAHNNEYAVFTPGIMNTPIEIGRGWQYQNQNRPFYGSIQCIRIYNRVLTDEEVANNYAIDKARFNTE